MTNILLVDDNRSIINALMEITDWESHGCTIAGCCYNGAEALEFIRQNPVDILITDMKMPVMDGISLLRHLKEEKVQISTIVLSSYDEFQLVRESFLLGTEEYLLKNMINEEDLVLVIKNLMAKIAQQRQYQDNAKREAEIFWENSGKGEESYFDFFKKKEDFYKRVLLQKGDIPTEHPFLNQVGVVLYTSVQNYLGTLVDDWNSDYETMQFAILFMIDEVLKENHFSEYVDCFAASASEYVFIITKTEQISAVMKQVLDTLASYLSVEFSYGVSEQKLLQNCLKEQYHEAIKNYYLATAKQHNTDISDYLRNCLLDLESYNPQEVLREIKIVNQSDDFILRRYSKYAVVILAAIEELGVEMKLESYADEFFEEISNGEDIYQYEDWFERILSAIREAVSALPQSALVQQMVSYVHNNYQENIQMETMARELNVSYGYASKLFIQHTGQKFTRYLNKYRIKKAIELMSGTNLKFADIAERVGYNNVEHFGRTFKAMMGKTPMEYKKSMKE